MATSHKSASLSTYAVQLETLRKIEYLGGYTGYDMDPDAFSDLAPVLDPFDPNVWARAINELARSPAEPSTQALKSKLQAELDLQHSDPTMAQKQRISNIIQGIESLGGSVGFQKFMVNSRAMSSQSNGLPAAVSFESPAATDEWPHCYATGFVRSTLVITYLDIFADRYSGSGHAWGPALGVGNLQGVLFYSSFDADSFNFENMSVGTEASMRLNGVVTSFFVGALIGVSKGFTFEGTWSW